MTNQSLLSKMTGVLLLSLCSLTLTAATWFQNDLENMPATQTAGADQYGNWQGLKAPHFTLQKDKNGSQCLSVNRPNLYYEILFSGKSPLPKNRNFTISFRAKKIKGQVFTSLVGAGDKAICGIFFSQTGKLMIYDAQQRWADSGIIHAKPGWLTIQLKADVTEGTYQVTLTDETGKTQTGRKSPLLRDISPAKWKIGNCMPAGSQWLFDDLKITYDDQSVLKNRQNVIDDNTTISRKGKVSTIDLKSIVLVSTLRIKTQPEKLISARGRNNMGQWIQLAKNAKADTKGFLQIDFKPEKLNLLEITSDIPCENIELYTDQISSSQKKNRDFQAKVYGEFYLPVYTDEVNADLHLFNTSAKPIPVTITLKNRKTRKAAGASRKVNLTPGENIVNFPLASIPTGEFAAIIEDQATKGSFSRCLRRQIQIATKAKASQDFTGEKMFFPDDFYMQKCQGLNFTGGKGEIIKVSKTNSVPGLVMQCGTDLYVENGCLKVPFYCCDNYFRTSSYRYFLASASLANPTQWTQQEVPLNSCPPRGIDILETTVGTVRGDWNPKPGKDGKIQYRLYNPATDGPVNVRQVEIKWFSFAQEGIAGHTPIPQCAGVSISPRTTWVLWHKQPGLTLILGTKPLLRDGVSADELGGEEDSNDNFAGQYLSDDGKCLYYIRGRILRRYPPYNVPYDNGADIVRMLTVFKTTDGIHFQQSFMAVPNHEDIPGTQHYGARTFKLRQGHGLRLALLLQYFGWDQRIAPTIAYSHDGFTYKRLPHSKPLVDNGPAGSWNAGSIMIGHRSILHEGNLYYMLAWSCSAYHICSELMWDRANMNTVTGPFVKNYTSGRQIEKWPRLKDFKDWEALAKNIRETTINVSLMKIREDGLFYVTAENGSFTTIPLTSKGKKLSANVEFKNKGTMTVELLSLDGKIAQSTTVAKSGVNVPIFSNLPAAPFQLRVKLTNAALYSLKF